MIKFSELAKCYFGDSQSVHSSTCSLSRMIRKCKPLCEDLKNLGHNNGDRYLTNRMVSCIYQHLGEP